ncbi:MAG: double zinc ribbon domain-containing protein [Candidatus Bipolaricaulia bacterium]
MTERGAVLLDELARGALKLLYPPHCYLCNCPLEDGFLCPSCYAQLPRPAQDEPGCARCGAPLADPALDLCPECAARPWFFTEARSFGYYEAGLAELIKGLKFGGERALARELARYLFEAGGELFGRAEALTFVPMTQEKLRRRGFNQAELLARELSGLTGLPAVSALVKVHETEEQAALGGQERWKNVQGAFAPKGEALCARIILVDDVYTTGATAEECSRALREGGYEEVYVLTVARARSRLKEAGDASAN